MDLVLNNRRWLICHETKPNQTKPNQTKPNQEMSLTDYMTQEKNVEENLPLLRIMSIHQYEDLRTS